jgi:hypothetical protein
VKRLTAAILGGLFIASAGFAAAAIGSHGKFLDLLTGTSSTSATTTGTTPIGRRVTICHRTHSWKHREHTITVSQFAIAAHLRHGDHLGPCAATGTTTGTLPTVTTNSGPKGHGDDGDDDSDSGPSGHGHSNDVHGASGQNGHGNSNQSPSGHGHGRDD